MPPALQPVSFSEIPGWNDDDHSMALTAFLAGAALLLAKPPKSRLADAAALAAIARRALALAAPPDRCVARTFFESNFRPARIVEGGFLTAYYEPEVEASRAPSDDYSAPLYRPPETLVELGADERPATLDPSLTWGLATPGGIVACPDRAAIEAGALAGRGLELAWLRSPVDAFFIHVQGSARLVFADGSVARVAFAGKSGHPYTSIGRLAVERGLLPLAAADRDGLDAWLRREPGAGKALMAENRSFIFFRETGQSTEAGPLGAAGVPLTPGRSLAVDRALHTFHTPIFVAAGEVADLDRKRPPWRRLMIAHDTGSAIVGAARGDLFFGAGDEAGSRAGRVRNAATFFPLLPRGDAA